MTPETLNALRGSIQKWREIVAGTRPDLGAKDCPLCHLFNNDDTEYMCKGCPDMDRVSVGACLDTPYAQWSELKDREIKDKQRRLNDHTASTPASKAAAQAELDFLISLLPEGEVA